MAGTPAGMTGWRDPGPVVVPAVGPASADRVYRQAFQ
jgi:hypothetical protein